MDFLKSCLNLGIFLQFISFVLSHWSLLLFLSWYLYDFFQAAFAEKYSTPLCPGQYGFPGLSNLVAAFPDTLAIRGRGTKKLIYYLREGRKSFSNGTSSRPLNNSMNSTSSYGSDLFGASYNRPNPRTATYVPPKHLPPQKQYEQRSSMASSNGYGYR